MSPEIVKRHTLDGHLNDFPEVTFFPVPEVSIEDMDVFFHLNSASGSAGRLLVSTNNVVTSDGILSLADTRYTDARVGLSGAGVNGLHLKGVRPNLQGAGADARLLQYGFAQCATVASSSVLEAEKDLLWRPWDPDLRTLFDNNHVKNPAVRVVVTRSGKFNGGLGKYPLFNQESGSNIIAVIATTDSGKSEINREIEHMEKRPNVIVESFGENGVDMVKLVEYMGGNFKIDEIDWQGGGQLTGEAFKAGIIGIFRITYSPIVAGSIDFQGNTRPTAVRTFLDTKLLTSMRLRKSAFCYSHELKIFDNLIYK